MSNGSNWEAFSSTGGAGVVIPTKALITGHTTTGTQSMVFRFYSADSSAATVPCTVFNPNSTNDARLGQTQSFYTITEIEP